MQLSVKSTFIMCDFHACKWKNAYTCLKNLNIWRILMNCLCIYISETIGAFMHVYVWEHIVNLHNLLINVNDTW